MSSRSTYLPFIAFCSLGIIWGSNFIYMKMAADLISPLQIVFYRVLFGFVPVFIYALYCRALSWHHLKHTPHFMVMALLATTVYFYCFVKGTSLLLSGIAGAVSGAIPLFSFLLALAFIDDEKGGIVKSLGILIGFAGVALIARPSGVDLSGNTLEGVAYMAVGSLSVGASFVYAKKFIIPLRISAAALTTYQLGIGLFMLALVTDFQGIERILTDTCASVGLLVGLGLLGTGIAYILYYYIVQRLGAVTASSVTYIPPIVALLIGAVVVGEPISPLDYAATSLIFVGVFLLKNSEHTVRNLKLTRS